RDVLTSPKDRGMGTPSGILPTTTVVVPVYDAARRLPALLEALARQSVPAGQIVLIDDGSSDGSADVAASWEAAHGQMNLRILRQSHQGPAVARNLGARGCNAEVLLFIDSDCVPETDWVAQMLAPFADPGIVGVQGAYRTSQR